MADDARVDYEDDDEERVEIAELEAALPPAPARGSAAYMAEFIGTLALVFFITLTLSIYLPAPPAAGQPQVVQPFIDWSVIGLVHVFVLFMLIQTLAFVCGAHFNPAVTTAMLAIRQIRPVDAGIYIVLQFAGAVSGTLLTKLFLSDEGDAINYGAVGLSTRIGEKALAGFGLEAIGTFFLMWAIVGVAVNPRAFKPWAAFVIAGTLGLGVMSIGPLTGAGFNPARAFGPELVSGELSSDFGTFFLAYIVGPVVGAVAAAFTYLYVVLTPGWKQEGLLRGPVS